jgi:hypothetical protein
MRTSIASVTNKLESTNHLSHCEETQYFSTNDCSSCQLSCIDIPDLLEDTAWGGI